MRTVRTKVYSFDELSKEAQQVAIENYRNNNDDLELFQFNEDCITVIEEKGFVGIDLRYSLSYSQGDGVCFSANDIKYPLLVSFFREILGENKEKTIETLIENSSFTLNGYNKRSTFASKSDIDYTLQVGFKDYPNCEKIIAQVLDKLENYYVDLCKELEKNGYKEIEWLDSDEYITETIKANDYEFLSNGKQY